MNVWIVPEDVHEKSFPLKSYAAESGGTATVESRAFHTGIGTIFGLSAPSERMAGVAILV